MNRRRWTTIKWAAGIALVAAVLWFNRSELQQALAQDFHVPFLLIAGVIYMSCTTLTFIRWYLLVRPQGLPFHQWDALRLGFIGLFFNSFLPGSVTGDLVKAGLMAREHDRRLTAITTILVDRGIGLYGLMLLTSFMGAIFWETAQQTPALRIAVQSVWGITAGLTLFVFVIAFLPDRAESLAQHVRRVPGIGGIVAEGMTTFHHYRVHWRYGLAAIVLAVIGHVGFVMSYYFAARATPGAVPSLSMHYLIIPVGMVVQALPLTPGNLGVSEGAFKYLYEIADPTLDVKGVLVCLAQRLVTWSAALIGLVLYIPLRRTVRQVLDESETLTSGAGPSGEEHETVP